MESEASAPLPTDLPVASGEPDVALPAAPAAPPPKPYPGFAQSLGLMALLGAAMASLGALVALADRAGGTKLLENAAVLGGVNLISFTAVSIWVGRMMGFPLRALLAQAPPPGAFSLNNLLLLFWAVAGQLMCAVGCVYAIGGKNVDKSEYVERLNKVLGPEQAWWAVVPVLVLVAPFTEEILFRGQFLRGYLRRYSAPVAIGTSAALFSLMHGNLVQIPATLMLGVLSGVLYERTRSVWPSIVAHMVNNSLPAMAVLQNGLRGGGGKKATPEFDPALSAMLGLIAAGMAVWIFALYSLRRNIPAAVAEASPEPALDVRPADGALS